MSLQTVITQIQGLSASESDLDSLNTQLKPSQVDSLLKGSAGAIYEALQTLDMQAHSLGYLYLLEAKGRHACPPQGDILFFEATTRFLTLCDCTQVRRAAVKFTSLCSIYRAQAVALGKTKHCILPLRTAIKTLCPTPGAISPIHADFFQACLLAKCYSAAEEILQEEAHAVDPGATGVTSTDILLYCYYGGMLETGRRRYTRAFDLYLTAIVAPTGVVNAITMACLKKLYLVSLLINGESPSLPKYTSPPVLRAMKSECAAYIELAKVAANASTAAAGAAGCSGAGGANGVSAATVDLAAFATSKSEIWRADGNVGLVRRVVETGSKRNIRAITRTFSSLSAAGVAQRAGLSNPQESEIEILRMIESGEVNARINKLDNMAEFGTPDSDVFASTEAAAKLEELLERCMELSTVVAAADHSVSCDRAFISKTEVNKNVLGGGGRIDLTPGPSGAMMGSLGGSGEDLPFLGGGSGSGGGGSEGQEGLPMSSPAVELLDNLDDSMF
ncbi:hypothetical protein Ndes2437B_g02090 [Nannochloris sp. 'desiccata']